MNDVKVIDYPKFLTYIPDTLTRSFVIPAGQNDEFNIVVPLSLKGVTSYFNSRKPTLMKRLKKKENHMI